MFVKITQSSDSSELPSEWAPKCRRNRLSNHQVDDTLGLSKAVPYRASHLEAEDRACRR